MAGNLSEDLKKAEIKLEEAEGKLSEVQFLINAKKNQGQKPADEHHPESEVMLTLCLIRTKDCISALHREIAV